MTGLYTIVLLMVSNTFMTLAWYGHLKLQEWSWGQRLSLLAIIALSWGLAFFEYCFQVPANRFGYAGHGGPFSLFQLKILQEVLSLVVFTIIALLLFKSEQLRWNHLWSFLCILGAVYFAFRK